MILLNPGPVNLTRGVRRALAGPDLCHRETEFADLQDSIRRRLLAVYGLSASEWVAVLLAGSGTAAVEAMLTSLVPRDRKLLVIENGVYGERMTAIAKVYGIDRRVVTYEWSKALQIRDVERALEVERDISHVTVVHHETTTGRLNRLAELGDLCAARGVDLLIDAVSSFGAEELDCERWGIAGCAATANKCLHGAPGVSFVIVRRERLVGGNARSFYLDLAAYRRKQDERSTPFTQPVQLCYALDRALVELEEEGGWRARRERYRALARMVREGLSAMGIGALLAEDETSVVLSAYRLPNGWSYDALHDALKARGFVIYAGQGDLARSIFRIAVMGAIADADIDGLLRAFSEVVRTV